MEKGEIEMKTLIVNTAYGYQELRQVYQRYMAYSLSLAASLMVTCIIVYQIQQSPPPVVSDKGKDTTYIIDLGNWQPPLDPTPRGGLASIVPTNLGKGIPVPMPDFMIDPTKEYASQKQLADDANRQFFDGEKGLEGGGSLNPPEPFYPSPDTFIAFQYEPMVVLNPKPEYPELLARTGIEGDVFLKVLISTDGKVIKSIVLKSNNDLFIQPAVDAVKKWAFTPALMNNRPVAVWVSIPFRFRLAKM